MNRSERSHIWVLLAPTPCKVKPPKPKPRIRNSLRSGRMPTPTSPSSSELNPIKRICKSDPNCFEKDCRRGQVLVIGNLESCQAKRLSYDLNLMPEGKLLECSTHRDRSDGLWRRWVWAETQIYPVAERP